VIVKSPDFGEHLRAITAQMGDPEMGPVTIVEPWDTGIYLYWLPLGAGGSFVRFNGRVFELIQAGIERRNRFDLYHKALVVVVPDGRFVIENSWPIPDAEGPSRGVVLEGPVFARSLGRFEVFRYEVRCWRDGVIADQAEAVESPQCVSTDPQKASRILQLVDSVPQLVWGRDEQSIGDMWNSNSVISYLLARSGVAIGKISPPPKGRAPGWHAGIATASRYGPASDRSPEPLD
jgi:hypothetical protein